VTEAKTCCMSEKRAFVRRQRAGQESMSELCRQFRISRKTGYQWVARARGEAGWDGSPRGRGRRAWVMTEALKAQVLRVREQYPYEGPRKLRDRLAPGPRRRPPAASTVGEFLRSQGLIRRRRLRRHCAPSAQPFTAVNAANDLWCMDFKGWFLTGDGRRCDVLTLTDAYSRLLLVAKIITPVRWRRVKRAVEKVFRRYGLPKAMRSDNGPPFASTGAGGLTRLGVWLLKQGIKLERIEPGAPQQNGRHERMHLTLKQQACTPPAANRQAQARRLNQFRDYYNNRRPHQALGQRPPVEFYRPSPLRFPRLRAWQPSYPPGSELRRVRNHGEIKWHGKRIFISEVLASETVALQRNAQGELGIHFADLELGAIDPKSGKLRKPAAPVVLDKERAAPAQGAGQPRDAGPHPAEPARPESKTQSIFPPLSTASERAGEKCFPNQTAGQDEPVTHLPV